MILLVALILSGCAGENSTTSSEDDVAADTSVHNATEDPPQPIATPLVQQPDRDAGQSDQEKASSKFPPSPLHAPSITPQFLDQASLEKLFQELKEIQSRGGKSPQPFRQTPRPVRRDESVGEAIRSSEFQVRNLERLIDAILEKSETK